MPSWIGESRYRASMSRLVIIGAAGRRSGLKFREQRVQILLRQIRVGKISGPERLVQISGGGADGGESRGGRSAGRHGEAERRDAGAPADGARQIEMRPEIGLAAMPFEID